MASTFSHQQSPAVPSDLDVTRHGLQAHCFFFTLPLEIRNMIYLLLSIDDLVPIYIPIHFHTYFERYKFVRLYIDGGWRTVTPFLVNRQFSTELAIVVLDNAELCLTMFDPFKNYSSRRPVVYNFPNSILQRIKHTTIESELPGNAKNYVNTVGKYERVRKRRDGVKILTEAMLHVVPRLGSLRILQINLYQSLETSIGDLESSLLLKNIQDLHSLSACAVNMRVIELFSPELDQSDESTAENSDESGSEESEESSAKDSDEYDAGYSDEFGAEEFDKSNAEESDEYVAEESDESAAEESEESKESAAEESKESGAEEPDKSSDQGSDASDPTK